MAKYKIVVLRYDDNPLYEAEIAKFKHDSLHNRTRIYDGIDESMPHKELSSRCLEVFLTEGEYAAVKQAVLTTFK